MPTELFLQIFGSDDQQLLQWLLHMPLVEFASSFAESTEKV